MPEIFRRFDRVELQRPSVKRTDEGYLRGEAIVTRTGIFLYKNPDGTIRRELRHPRDVFSATSLDTFKMIPIVMGHPETIFVTAENVKTLQVGYTGEDIKVDGDYVITTLTITDEEAIKAIEQGRRELSCGYGVMHGDPDGGTWDGQKYDVKQINIHYNHIAIVSEGRAGAMARLNLDKQDAFQTDEGESNMPEKILKQIVIDSITYEAAPEVINALGREKQRADDLQKQIDGMIDVKITDTQIAKAPPEVAAAFDKLRGEKDGLKEKLDKAEKQVSPEEIQKLVKKRQRIVDAARKVMDKDSFAKADEMTDVDLMKEVVVQSALKEKQEAIRTNLKDAAESYVEGRFEQVLDGLPETKDNATAQQRQQTTGSPLGKGDEKEPDLDAARKRYIDRLERGFQDDTKSKDNED